MTVMSHLKDLEAEVLAYRATFLTIKQEGLVYGLDDILRESKRLADIQMNAKYDKTVNETIQQMRRKNDDEELTKVLSKLAPAKYLN